MIVIEAVRTGCWMAITGQRQVVTVTAIADELRRGDPGVAGYVIVTDEHIARMQVATLASIEAVSFRLRYADADGMDDGERDLMAYAGTLTTDFELCGCDKALVRAAHGMGVVDRVVSLEALADSVGARARPPLKAQFCDARLGQWRTTLMLGGTI